MGMLRIPNKSDSMSPISSPSDPVPDSQATRASEVAAAGLDLGRGGSSATAASPPGGALGPQGEISGFEFGEAEVAEVSGLAAKFLTAIRHKNLRQGDHWNLVGLRVAARATTPASPLSQGLIRIST
jgi:hypothetical protein